MERVPVPVVEPTVVISSEGEPLRGPRPFEHDCSWFRRLAVKDTPKSRKCARDLVDYLSHDELRGPYRPWNLVGVNNAGTIEEEKNPRWEWGLGAANKTSYFKFMKIDKYLHLVCDWNTQPSTELRRRALAAEWDVSTKAAGADAGAGSPQQSSGAAAQALPSAPPMAVAVAVAVNDEVEMERGQGVSLSSSDVKLYEEPGVLPPKRQQMSPRSTAGGSGGGDGGSDSDEEYYYGPRDPPHLRKKNKGRFETFTALGGCCLYIVGCFTCLGLLVGQTSGGAGGGGGGGGDSCIDADKCSDCFTKIFECSCCECDCDCHCCCCG